MRPKAPEARKAHKAHVKAKYLKGDHATVPA